jgi:leucyl aminopeptidase
MNLQVSQQSPEQAKVDCLAVGIFEGQPLNTALQALDNALGGRIQRRIDNGDFLGKAGSLQLLFDVDGIEAKRLLLIGLGKADKLTPGQFKKVCAAANDHLASNGNINAAAMLLDGLNIESFANNDVVRLAAYSWEHSGYRYTETLSKTDAITKPVSELELLLGSDADTTSAHTAAEEGLAMATGANYARHLANLPPNVCTPSFLAEQARGLANGNDKVDCDILDRDQMAELGMGSLLGVAQGSAQPPKLIVLKYNGAGEGQQPYVLVGKGITFDTGGISLKPGPGMHEMKYDMGGAASVIGTFHAVTQMELPINLVVIVPAVENMPGSNAYRPGDVLTSMSGQTIEVLNTDAEGRLILCDALTYAERFNPAALIDVATLTGACIIALGHEACGIMSRHDDLANELVSAGLSAADRGWRLPLWDEYDEALSTPHADFSNMGGKGAGTITAGCFLGRFTREQRWAHVDIAGVAWTGGKPGATGRPVALLTQYLLDRC